MSVLIVLDQSDNQIKKSAFEILSYGSQLAAQMGISAEALVMGTVHDDLAALGKYGVTKVTGLIFSGDPR